MGNIIARLGKFCFANRIYKVFPFGLAYYYTIRLMFCHKEYRGENGSLIEHVSELYWRKFHDKMDRNSQAVW